MNSERLKHYYDAAPLLVVICILPFVVRCHFYEYYNDSFGTFIEDVPLTDFFSYTRSIVFGVLALYMAYRMTYDMMQGRFRRPCFTVCVCFLTLLISLILSSAAALNGVLAVFGGYQRFEGALTKGFYIVLALYTYQVSSSKELRRILWNGSIITAAVEAAIGLMQLLGHDPFAMSLIQKLILPAGYGMSEIENILGDNRVYLTLANPNYAAMYLAVMIIIVTCSVVSIEKRKWAVPLAALDILLYIELVGTRSRVGVFMLAVTALAWACLYIKGKKKDKEGMLSGRKTAAVLAGLVAFSILAGIGADKIFDIGMWERVGDSFSTLGEDRRNCDITQIETGRDSFGIAVSEASISASFKDQILDTEHLHIECKNEGKAFGTYNKDNGRIVDETGAPKEGLENLLILMAEDEEGEPLIMVKEHEAELFFAFDSDMGYLIYAGNGYYEQAEDIEHIDMNGFESAASGRGYIWSRAIPLMKGFRLLTGHGSDNFYLAYPQNDYLGKAQYCENPYVIIEKPHNTFILYGVENGLLAMASFIILIIILTLRCLRRHDQGNMELICAALILIAYTAGFFFNDSSIVISPFFWLILGMGYRLTDNDELIKKPLVISG